MTLDFCKFKRTDRNLMLQDGIHPNSRGHRVMAKSFAPYLKKATNKQANK